MKIYKYYIVYDLFLTKEERVKKIPRSIELELYDKIKTVNPISEMIKEIELSNTEDKDIEAGILIHNWKLLDEYEVEE